MDSVKTLIFGHKNPDTDSVCSAIAYSYLKNELQEQSKPYVLGKIQKETQFVLDSFNVEYPEKLNDVKIQVKDLKYTEVTPIKKTDSILHAFSQMDDNHLRTLPITDINGYLEGIVTMKDIAMEMIKGDFYNVETSVANILSSFEAFVLNMPENKKNIKGRLSVIAYYYKTVLGELSEDDIIIVGDRYDIIEMAIKSHVELIVISGNFHVPEKYVLLAKEHNVALISIDKDTYSVSKLFQQCSFISKIMKRDSIVKFTLENQLEDIKDDILSTNYRNYPVVDMNGKFLGFIGRKHLIDPGRKKVIMVDHNEFAQSADGIEEAEITEIIDHHKIGGISTNLPINFVNIPVGSTCTIVYEQYLSYGIHIPVQMASLMISGIISDTLFFKSPTCTQRDITAVKNLNKIANLDLDEYSMKMFKAGTSLEGYSAEQIFYRDFKEFVISNKKTGISQIFTLDIDEVKSKQEQLTDYMENLRTSKNYDLLILAITDIVNEGSYFFYSSTNENIIANAFSIESSQGAFAKDIVSRKKQIVPMLTKTIEAMRS